MKILYYHQHFSTPSGATGTRSYEFARRLIKRGHSVTMVCGSYWIADSGLKDNFRKGRRTGNVDGINVIEFELKYSNTDSVLKRTLIFLKYSLKGIIIALQENYDIIFASSTPLTAGLPGIFAKIFRNKPFIFEVRDLWPDGPKAMGVINNPIIFKLIDLLETITYIFSTACIGLSPGIVSGITRKVSKKMVIMIPNGCDLNLVENFTTKKNNTKIVAAFTGAHGIANGLDIVLDTAKILLEKYRQDISIQFIGDGMLKPKLEQRVKNERLSNCQFLEPMSKYDMFRYLNNNVDIGLMILDNIPAFYFGTSPNKFFDYISLGLPVINNYPGWLAEIIENNQCGIVVPPDNPEAFAEGLIKLADDVNLRTAMGENSRQLAIREFDRDVLSDRFVDYLQMTTIKRNVHII
ncbi:MAG: glycosyltransferase family 4 protein [Mariniphaga sp.]|nr:glycosyltransferase family 4 protein [Mariniphaga sp.]